MSFKSARIRAEKTVAETAKAMGVSRAAVYYWEYGESMPEASKLVELADFYGCTVDRLLRKD